MLAKLLLNNDKGIGRLAFWGGAFFALHEDRRFRNLLAKKFLDYNSGDISHHPGSNLHVYNKAV